METEYYHLPGCLLVSRFDYDRSIILLKYYSSCYFLSFPAIVGSASSVKPGFQLFTKSKGQGRHCILPDRADSLHQYFIPPLIINLSSRYLSTTINERNDRRVIQHYTSSRKCLVAMSKCSESMEFAPHFSSYIWVL